MKKTEHYKQPLNFCKKVGNEKYRFSSCIIFKQPVLSLSSATLPRILSSRMAAFPESQRDLLHCMHWPHHARGTFFARTTYFPYRGCFTRRFTSTATVLFLLLLTTSPTKVRLIDGGISFILLSIADCLLGQYRLHPCNRTARFFQLTGICQLLSRQLHTQAHTCF